ncbi:MAG: hypothetical protein J7L75_01570 [Thermoproteales archaeon]|nr:hypothetical protein [Thermoproteales archaeon]
MSEAYRHVVSISVFVGVLLALGVLTFVLLIYADSAAAQRVAEMAGDRLLELIVYGAAERCVLRVSLSDIASRPLEVYAVNATHLRVEVPLKLFPWLKAGEWVELPGGVEFSYRGLLPPSFYLRFRESQGVVVVEARA